MPLLVLPKRLTDRRAQSALRRILTPIDFSIASAVALRTALELSRRHGARVTLVHALKDVPRHMVFSGSEAWKVVRRLPAQLDAVADRLRRKAALFGVTGVDTQVATGDADRAIVGIASRTDSDLIVMGIAHRSRFDRVVFGSTLRRVLRRANAPVLVVPVVAGSHTWPKEYDREQFNSSAWADSAVERVAA
jgi:nucleotide-binding universal stress UspA family protein